MLPYSCLDSLDFGQEFAVYYSHEQQGLYGEIIRSWTFDRFERGDVNEKKSRMYDLENVRASWHDVLFCSTENDLRIDSDGNLYAPSEILVTIRNPAYRDTVGPRKGLHTTYEVRASSPVIGSFGEVVSFNVQLERSADQDTRLSEDGN